MNKEAAVSVYEVVGSPFCVASGDGEKVYSRLASALKKNRGVSLSFRNVSALTAAFLNTAVGQLYGEFDEEQVHSLLKVEDMASNDAALLKVVKNSAKQYFKDPKGFEDIARKVLDGE